MLKYVSSSGAGKIRHDYLKGRCFLVTRTSEGNAKERRLLASYGARVKEFPTIRISLPSSTERLDKAIFEFEKFDWIVFTSSNGVRYFFQRLVKRKSMTHRKLRSLKRPRFACVGPSTKRALNGLGLSCSLMPRRYLTEELGRMLARKNIEGKNILLARAEVANRSISTILRRSGANVTDVAVYRTVIHGAKKIPVLRQITDVTLTSPSTVEGLLQTYSSTRLNSSEVRLHCIGPVTAERAKASNLKVETIARVHTISGLIRDIVEKRAKSSGGS